MTSNKNIETFLYLSNNKFAINVFSKLNKKIIFKDKLIFDINQKEFDRDTLIKFLDKNIFKIEKKFDSFINSLNLIIDRDNFNYTNISIKKNLDGDILSKKNHLLLISDLKLDFQKNYNDSILAHLIINNYLVDNVILEEIDNNIKCQYFSIEAKFISMLKKDLIFYQEILKQYQITINKIIDGRYIKNFFLNQNLDECEMGLRILSGANPNEVFFVKKKYKISGFFEKFFKLFS